MERPLISVIYCLYKEKIEWIRQSVESILNQTYGLFEFIIICDNPDYQSAVDLLKEYSSADPRIRLIVNEENIGITRSLNKGLELAKGGLVARMDADDIALPKRFEKQVDFLTRNPDISICGTDVHCIDGEGRITRRRKYRRHSSVRLLFFRNMICHPSVMFRKDILGLRNPLYDNGTRYSQDYELWTFLMMKGCRFHTLDEVLMLYRRSGKQISSAHRETQAQCFKKAHKAFVTQWLISKGIICHDDTDNVRLMLKKASEAYNRASVQDRGYLEVVIFTFYFTLSTSDRKYIWKYLTDSNGIMFKVPFHMTYLLLMSRKTRRDRSGFLE